MRVEKLDRIFDGYDVIVVRLIDQIDNRRQRRALTTSGWSSDEHNTVFYIYYFFQYIGKVEIAKLGRPHGNHAHDDRVRAALLEDIHAEPSIAGNAERQVCGACLFKAFERRRLISDNQFGDAGRMGRYQLLQTRDANRHEFARQFDLWRPSGAEYQITDFI